MRIQSVLLALTISTLFFLSSCKDRDDPTPVNEEELITTVELKFSEAGNEPIVFRWSDADGSGPGVPVAEEIVLKAHTHYDLEITILDESKTPAMNVSEEIHEEGTSHQFFFESDDLQLLIEYNDVDEDGKPIGLINVAETDHESIGSLTVVLRHQPDKSAANVSSGDLTNAGGDTDVEVTFDVTIVE